MSSPFDRVPTPAFDHRLFLVSGYLHGRTAGKNILDLNCGEAPMFWRIHNDFDLYLATDKFPLQKHQDRPGNFKFKRMLDHIVPVYLEKKGWKIDILLVMGYAAHLDAGESVTLPDTILQIAKVQMPGCIVLDSAANLPPRCNLARLMVDLCSAGYKQEASWFIKPAAHMLSREAERFIYVLRGEWDD